MGVNNRQRRAAKQRRRARGHGPTPPRGPGFAGWPGAAGEDWGPQDWGPEDWAGLTDLLLVQAVNALPGVLATDDQARTHAASLLAQTAAIPRPVLSEVLQDLLQRLLTTLLEREWGPADLVEVVRRQSGAPHSELLRGCLGALADVPRLRARWGAELDELGAHRAVGPADVEELAVGLRLAALLACLPGTARDEAPPQQQQARGAVPVEAARRLATVRALLAKAESTDYDEEAEALSAKAQSLITQYALHHLLDRVEDGQGADGTAEPVVWRRLWLDAPYLMAKATLVNAVAAANRSRSVVTESLGFCTLVGHASDLDAIELLVTSLLAQANAAMLRHGRHVDQRGVSRTRSFRQSFLIAYAQRIGERLQESSEEALRSTGRKDALVPVLRQDATRVEDTVSDMFPALVSRETSVTNGLGWAAGKAAGDLALLDVHANLTGAAQP